MDFGLELSEDQRALKHTVREYAEAEIAPHAAEWDRTGFFPSSTIRQLGVLGVMGLGATSGQHVTVTAEGPDAEEAVATIVAILAEATRVGA